MFPIFSISLPPLLFPFLSAPPVGHTLPGTKNRNSTSKKRVPNQNHRSVWPFVFFLVFFALQFLSSADLPCERFGSNSCKNILLGKCRRRFLRRRTGLHPGRRHGREAFTSWICANGGRLTQPTDNDIKSFCDLRRRCRGGTTHHSQSEGFKSTSSAPAVSWSAKLDGTRTRAP